MAFRKDENPRCSRKVKAQIRHAHGEQATQLILLNASLAVADAVDQVDVCLGLVSVFEHGNFRFGVTNQRLGRHE